MVRQFVAEVSGAAGFRFRVFTTGSDRHYLLVCTRNPAISFAVLRADLRPDVRAALAHGHAPRQERSPR
jgi:hypothetical protein